MSRRSRYNDEDFEYEDDEYEGQEKGQRRFKKEEKVLEKKKRWDRESIYDHDNDYHERR
ncbi:MAG TPA: hypothetical protein VIY47_14050 [Ignavibacteriaceae bacterium]